MLDLVVKMSLPRRHGASLGRSEEGPGNNQFVLFIATESQDRFRTRNGEPRASGLAQCALAMSNWTGDQIHP